MMGPAGRDGGAVVLLFVCATFLLAACGAGAGRAPRSSYWVVEKRVPRSARRAGILTCGSKSPDTETRGFFEERLADASSAAVDIRAQLLGDIGITAFFNGCYGVSAQALDEAIRITTSFTSDPRRVRDVTALEGKEQLRIFKGEAHERAALFLFRGLIYLRQGDYGNARACFKSGQLQDVTSVENRDEAANWLSLRFLERLTDRWEQRGARRPWELGRIPEGLAAPEPGDSDDGLLVIAVGEAPRKILLQSAEDHRLSYVVEPDRDIHVSLTKVGEPATPLLRIDKPMEDIFIQAVSRGRRAMDEVIAAKKRTQAQASTNADVSQGVASVASAFGIFGLPVALASALYSTSERETAASARTAPDLRRIVSVPAVLYLGTFPSGDEVRLRISRGDGTEVLDATVRPRSASSSWKHDVVSYRVLD